MFIFRILYKDMAKSYAGRLWRKLTWMIVVKVSRVTKSILLWMGILAVVYLVFLDNIDNMTNPDNARINQDVDASDFSDYQGNEL